MTSDLDSPVVAETSVKSNLLHSFKIVSKLGIKIVGDHLSVVSVSGVSLSVQEPLGNVVIGGSSNDVIDFIQISFSQLSSSIHKISIPISRSSKQ